MNIQFTDDSTFRVDKDKNTFTFGQLFQNTFGVFRLNGVPGLEVEGKEYNIIWRSTARQAAMYAPMVRVSPKIAGSNIYNVQIDYSNSQLASEIVNSLMQQYLGASIEDKNITIDQRLEYIVKQLARLEKDLDSIESKRIKYMDENNLIDVQTQLSYFFSLKTEADKNIEDQKLQLVVLDQMEEYLKNAANNFEKTPSALTINDATLAGLVDIYNTKQFERKKLIDDKIPEANPQIIAVNDDIEKIRQKIMESLSNLRKLYNTAIDEFYKRGAAAISRQKAIPEKVQLLLEMERERDGKLALYKFLQEQREETAMQQASTISNSKILEFAQPTTVPIKPNRKGIQLLAIILGLGLPAMYIFFKEVVNDKVNTRHDIEKLTDASILGEVGHSYSSSAMMVSKTNRSMVSEQFRIIRSNLQYVLNKVEKPVIMITSSFSSEGKSFVSTNLGGVMALAGKKTVLLEFDIRKPKLFSGMKLAGKSGITNFLVGKSKMEDLPVKVPGFESLYAISCGPVPPNPSELLLDDRVREMFDWLRENFDVVIIDTAPVGMVSDAMTLGKFADTTLYIVRQEYTYKKQISLIDEFYRENRLPKISIIINDVKLKPGYGYYGYGRYGYGYGYGGGYYETDENAELVRKPFLKRMLNLFKRK
jgi:capsular exopolysaccharide synthesis family protein